MEIEEAESIRGQVKKRSASASLPVAWRLPELIERLRLVQGLGYRQEKGSQGIHDLAEFLRSVFQAGLPKEASPLSPLRRFLDKGAGKRDGFRIDGRLSVGKGLLNGTGQSGAIEIELPGEEPDVKEVFHA